MKIIFGAAVGAIACFFTYSLLRWTAAKVMGVDVYPGTASWWFCAAAPMLVVAVLAAVVAALGKRSVRAPAAAFLIAYVVPAIGLAVFSYAYYT